MFIKKKWRVCYFSIYIQVNHQKRSWILKRGKYPLVQRFWQLVRNILSMPDNAVVVCWRWAKKKTKDKGDINGNIKTTSVWHRLLLSEHKFLFMLNGPMSSIIIAFCTGCDLMLALQYCTVYTGRGVRMSNSKYSSFSSYFCLVHV